MPKNSNMPYGLYNTPVGYTTIPKNY